MSARSRPRLRDLPRSVWLLGWTSFFTDTASEAIYPLLPVFLTRVLGASPVSLGIIEGAAEAANSVLKIASGYLSDRWRLKRPIVIAGYSLSSIVRPFIGVATGWMQVFAIRVLDRTGKGMRGAPRDALLAANAPRDSRGLVFGFHRAMDHAGAVAGPLVATVFLLAFPEHYRTLFLLTIVPGAVAVALLFKVPERTEEQASSADTAGRTAMSVAEGHGRLPAKLYGFLAIVLLFNLGNSSDAFLLLRLGDTGIAPAWIPFMWAMLHVVKASLSTFGGRLSDRGSRQRAIASGWVVYAIVYGGFAFSDSEPALVAWFLAYGLYFALSEGAERALIADLTPPSLRGAAFGLYNAALGVGMLLASVVFGFVWTAYGAPYAFGLGAGLAVLSAGLLLAIAPQR